MDRRKDMGECTYCNSLKISRCNERSSGRAREREKEKVIIVWREQEEEENRSDIMVFAMYNLTLLTFASHFFFFTYWNKLWGVAPPFAERRSGLFVYCACKAKVERLQFELRDEIRLRVSRVIYKPKTT